MIGRGEPNQGDRSGADPEQPGDGREALAGTPAASQELERAGAEGEARPASRAGDALDQVEGLLRAGDLRTARRAMVAARALAGAAEVGRADALDRRLASCERLQGPSALYAAALARGDSLTARNQAAIAAGLAEGDEAVAWRARSDELAHRIRIEWRLGEVELDADVAGSLLADCADLLDTSSPLPEPLLVGGMERAEGAASLVLASVFGRWIFVREVDVERRRLRRLGWLRAPSPLAQPTVQVHGDSIHIVGWEGEVLQLSRRPLDVVRWLSVRPFMLPDRGVEDALVLPPGRLLWAELKDPGENYPIAIIDLEEWRVCGRVHRVFSFDLVPGVKPTRILVTRDEGDEDWLCDERGAKVDWKLPADVSIKAMVAHPDGEGLLALVGLEEGEEDESGPLAIMELQPGKSPAKPVVIEGTDQEQQATLAVSLEKRHAWLLTHIDSQRRLIAFRRDESGPLEQAWSVEVPPMTSLARDHGSRNVIALTLSPRGLEMEVLGALPPRMEPAPSTFIDLLPAARPFFSCAAGSREMAEIRLWEDLWRHREERTLARRVEVCRRERRADPAALAALADALLRLGEEEPAETVLRHALDRHPSHPLLWLGRADLEACRDRWDEVERLLVAIATPGIALRHACHVHHLRGLARLHAGDARGAREHWSAGALLARDMCQLDWNLDLAGALLEPLDEEPQVEGSAMRRLVRACRLADAWAERGDHAKARDALEIPAVHAQLEVQSAARLAEAHLALEPSDAHGLFRKAVALARFASIDLGRRRSWPQEVPGLGWGPERLVAIAERAGAWLEEFARAETDGLPSETAKGEPEPSTAPGHVAAPAPEPAGQEASSSHVPHAGGPTAPPTHSLPLLGHEAIRELVPGLDAAVRETVRYARAQPGWDETQTLRDDLPEFTPVKAFLTAYLDRLIEGGMEHADAVSDADLLGSHLDYCVNFELHRRKLFFVDAALAWLLSRTSLDIEGRTLRLPFPCFGMAFTDRATLEIAEALLQKDGGILAGHRLQILTVYAKRSPAPPGRSGLSLSLVFDARAGQWPYLLGRELCFAEDDDLDCILDSHFADVDQTRSGEVFKLPEMRKLVHLSVNAILYATSANVPWPLAQSPLRKLRSESRSRGKAKQARVAHRVEELSGEYSSEDVFYLPGRIPISQLRALEQVERQPNGHELMARFMVRGHWRRASPVWRDQRLRWIEPYWKGPELAAIVEREYKLKI